MIVMKFGGSSLATARNVQRILEIVQSQVRRRPVVIVSAMGSTTNQLAAILDASKRGCTYEALTAQTDLKQSHFCLAEDLLHGEALKRTDQFLRDTFRDLHRWMLEVAEDGREVTPALKDQVLSLGEQISSRIIAEAFTLGGLDAAHVDSRKLILTDDHFTQAQPRYWETYANIRWTVPQLAKTHVPVLGGFIGATAHGETTTLGRGGSDLTASMVGAAINAEEIQVWKDVDGMLTMDPRLKSGGHRIVTLTYEEASALARGGAKILHPDTMAPAERLRIPIVLKNTFRPGVPGTRITNTAASCANPVKSIACQRDVTLLEIERLDGESDLKALAHQLSEVCRQQNVPGETVASSAETLYFAVSGEPQYEQLQFDLTNCVKVRIRPQHAILTLVCDAIRYDRSICVQIAALLHHSSAFLLPRETGSCAIKVALPAKDLLACLDLLEKHLFRTLDPRVFAPASVETQSPAPITQPSVNPAESEVATSPRPRLAFQP
jgi:aspartate kinase